MPRYGTRPPLARRWRRARLPSAAWLDGPRRPDRPTSHYRPHLAACRVVDCRNQGITSSTGPKPFRLGAGGQNPGRRWPRPVPTSKSKSPRCRLRPGGNGADVQVPCTRHVHRCPLARARFRWRPAAMGGACRATPRLAAAGCAIACRPRRWRFAPVRHEGRFTDTPPGLAMEHPHHASSMWSRAAAGALWPCRRGFDRFASGRKPVQPSRGDAESAMSPFGAGGPCVLGLS